MERALDGVVSALGQTQLGRVLQVFFEGFREAAAQTNHAEDKGRRIPKPVAGVERKLSNHHESTISSHRRVFSFSPRENL